MREYKIKRGHNVNVSELISKYFNETGDIEQGFNFSTDGIGDVFIQKKGSSLFIELKPPKTHSADFNVIKQWNTFLFEATGKTSKERKKDFSKT